MTREPAPIYEKGAWQSEICGHRMQQNSLAYATWNWVLLDLRPARVVELGTGNGGFSKLIAKTCQAIGAGFATYNLRQSAQLTKELAQLGAKAVQADLTNPEVQYEIHQLCSQPGHTVLLCDNGDKVRELHEFSSSLKSGDLLAAHDYIAAPELRFRYWWWQEVIPSDVVDLLDSFAPFHPEWFDRTAWLVLQRT